MQFLAKIMFLLPKTPQKKKKIMYFLEKASFITKFKYFTQLEYKTPDKTLKKSATYNKTFDDEKKAAVAKKVSNFSGFLSEKFTFVKIKKKL